ncbi:MAG TPA: sugar transferase, partial [Gaiellaceae bacterium]|nr:sugar transferase [Gaiellaceae bacterium]
MRIRRLAKQVLDRILAFALLVLLSPLLVVVVAWILVDSGRPVFFVYPRAGRFGRPFPMLKFRTMIPDAIEVGRAQKLSEDP